jgi:hydrogenase expression/formation protein HypD
VRAINAHVARLAELRGRLAFMEVCGTHTMAISATGIRRALDPRLRLLSGPGCPVCVTSQPDIDMTIELAQRKDVAVVTFGDMLRVPGTGGSLEEARAAGADIRIVYSPLDIIALAEADPGRQFVFVGVGFETTAPTIAATFVSARRRGLGNATVISLFKLVPPALRALVAMPGLGVDGFVLPGHVSAVIGTRPYGFLARQFRVPSCVAGFEAADILEAVEILLRQLEDGPRVAVQYRRVVRPEGNRRARSVMAEVFAECDAVWRGLGPVPRSGLRLKRKYQEFDAVRRFGLNPGRPVRTACRCGDIMLGRITPPECPLFGGRCTTETPVGPCMVSSEGACAAYYKYERTGS